MAFDRYLKNPLSKLGLLANNPHLTILDCFIWGNGAGSQIFAHFYARDSDSLPCRVGSP
jgi:hypothetical protein